MTKIERSNSRENNSLFIICLLFCCGCTFDVLRNTYNVPRITQYVQPLIQHEESFGRLVLLGYDVATFIPVTYQRSSLLRPSMEVSSCG